MFLPGESQGRGSLVGRRLWGHTESYTTKVTYLTLPYLMVVETVANFIFLESKITADGDCSNEIKRHLLLGRKVMTNLDSILKRDIKK